MIGEKAGGNKSISDAPLLAYAGKSAGSFVSHEGSLHEGAGAYQPLSLDSPRVLMHVPRSTRSSRSNSMVQQDPASIVSGRRNLLIKEQEEKDLKDPILSSVDAKQIGDIFRDALRKPPPVSEDGNASDSPGHRESMMILSNEDDDLDEEELDPGWRERVASERMIRELEQEASVIRTVAKKAHGSDYSSSRPETSQSDHAHQLQSPLQSPFES
ncbi:hypothetical protein GGI12_005319 [Dipsacomyces acuminosporus]|nr:hypothetical protein GGI12_005319 [Dipsacomyces acuminosporus]